MTRRVAGAVAIAFWCLLGGARASAADVPYRFESAEQEARYKRLVSELRCLVCQNQNLEDSHASLAQDLRAEVYEQVAAGATEQAVVEYLVARYGDFVRYRPPLRSGTALLWFGPVLLAGVGGWFAARAIRGGARASIADSREGDDK